MDEPALRSLLNNLDASRSSLHGLLHVFTWFVIFGLGFDLFVIVKEFRDDWKEFRYGQVHPSEIHLPKRPTVWLLILGLLGTALIVIGVWGEMFVDVKVGKVETDIKVASDALLGLIIQKAGDAAKSAKTAHDEADAVGTETSGIEKRLDSASSQMGILERNIAAQGPRAPLLIKASPEIVHAVSPFAGQRVRLFVCGQQGIAHQETLDTWGAIANILGSDTVAGVTGAKWKILDPNLGWAANCGAAGGRGQGQGVTVSKRAPKRTIEAATALARALVKVLPPSSNTMLGVIDPDFARMMVDRGFQPKDEPWNIVAFDEDLITVTVGEHP
jgi:hypothetical protein